MSQNFLIEGQSITIRRLRSQLDKIRDHVAKCPIGYVKSKMVIHRKTTDEQIVDWIKQLHAFAEAE